MRAARLSGILGIILLMMGCVPQSLLFASEGLLKIYNIQNIPASEMAERIEDLYKDREKKTKIVVDSRTNSIVVQVTDEAIQQEIEEKMKEYDVKQPQIYIRSVVLEGSHGNIKELLSGYKCTKKGRGVEYYKGDTDILTSLKLYKGAKKIVILGAPHIITADGRQGIISMGNNAKQVVGWKDDMPEFTEKYGEGICLEVVAKVLKDDKVNISGYIRIGKGVSEIFTEGLKSQFINSKEFYFESTSEIGETVAVIFPQKEKKNVILLCLAADLYSQEDS